MTQPHDRLVKQVFSALEEARGLLLTILPAEIVASLNFDTIELVPGSFVGARNQEKHADLAFRIETKQAEPLLVYVLFEHRSRTSRWLVLDMLGSVVRLLESFRRESSVSRLPRVVPVALIHDPRSRQVVDRIEDLMEPCPLWHDERRLQFGIFVHDLGSLEIQQIVRPPMTDYGALTLVLLRCARSEENLIHVLLELSELIRRVLDGPQGSLRFELLMQYTLEVSSTTQAEDLAEALARRIDRKAGEIVMTTADRLREQGRREGHTEGQRELIRMQLESRFGTLPPHVQVAVESASTEELSRMAHKILTAQSLEEVVSVSGRFGKQ
ncbi:MAG: Rpn family recombination-promoting nuclease/putative transposase [Planctomycetota bacterium]